jgi:hypothetical protein
MNLVTVQGSMSLDAPAASAWLAMEAAARKEFGVDLTITSPAGAYRSPAMVLDMYLSSPARRLAVYGVPIGTGVARPTSLGGNGSVHENGRCVDLWNHTAIARKDLVALARRFGFTFTISTEPWHMQHNGTTGAGAGGGGISTPQQRRLAMTARFLWADGPIWAGIDLVAFRSQGGVIVTTAQATADNLSRVYPFPAEKVDRVELNNSVIAARLWVDQVVNASTSTVDAKQLAAEIAPLLRVADSDLTEAEFVTHLEARIAELQTSISGVPAAVIVEQKKPGN